MDFSKHTNRIERNSDYIEAMVCHRLEKGFLNGSKF